MREWDAELLRQGPASVHAVVLVSFVESPRKGFEHAVGQVVCVGQEPVSLPVLLAGLDGDCRLDFQLVKGAVVTVCPDARCLGHVVFGCVPRVRQGRGLGVKEWRVVDVQISVSLGVCHYFVELRGQLEPAEVGETAHRTLEDDWCPAFARWEDRLEELFKVHCSPFCLYIVRRAVPWCQGTARL